MPNACAIVAVIASEYSTVMLLMVELTINTLVENTRGIKVGADEGCVDGSALGEPKG